MGALRRSMPRQGRSASPGNRGRRRGGPWFYLLSPLPIFLAAMAFSWPRLQAVQLGYKSNRLQVEKSQLTQLNAELKVERAGLRSPSRIDEIARRDLGMTDPSPEQLRWIRPAPREVSLLQEK